MIPILIRNKIVCIWILGESGNEGDRKLKEEKESLQSEVTMLSSRIALLESDKRQAEDQTKSLLTQVEMLKESATKYRYDAMRGTDDVNIYSNKL